MRKLAPAVLLALLVCAATSVRAQRATGSQPARRPATQATKPVAPSSPARSTPTVAHAQPAADDCGCEVTALPDVLAVVNGIKITSKEIDDLVADQVRQIQQGVADARRNELNVEINDVLLAAEARKRGKTPAQVLDEESAHVTEPTETEARAFYDQNKARIEGEWNESLRAQIVEYLRGERQQAEAQKFTGRLRTGAQVNVVVADPTPPATVAERARVFATVNGKQITSGMIEDAIRPLVFNAQQQIYSLRKQQLDLRIHFLLLGQEATRLQTTTDDVLAREPGAAKQISETDARTFYDQNKEHLKGSFEELENQIVSYLGERQQQETEAALDARLRRAAAVQTFLSEPIAPVYQISTDDQPSRGAATAPVTLIEFTDFQCPSCAAMQPVIERLMTEYEGRVRLVVRDFPLSQHAHARKAAEAAEAARAQGKYWEYARLLFANQQSLEVPKLKEYATQVGLDRARFDTALDADQTLNKVLIDLNEGNRLGVNATPSFFVNGRPLSERTYEGLKAMIDAALREKGRTDSARH
jgi:protein-disulfide isomerase